MNVISEASSLISSKLNKLRYDNDTIRPDLKAIINEKDPDIGMDWRNILGEPPANDSDFVKKELERMQELTKNISPKQKELIMDVDKDILRLYNPVLEKLGLKVPHKIIKKYWNDLLLPIVLKLKAQYGRLRPYQLGPVVGYDIRLIETDTHDTPAYPSGHTAYGALIAFILSDLYPEHAEEFHEVSVKVADARVLQGVHYPSDNDAGMIIAAAVWNATKHHVL